MSLRPYQSAAVDALRRSIAAGNRAPLLQAPTGSGKTIIAKSITESAQGKGNRVIFLAPRRELIYQTAEKLDSANISYGMVMAGEGRSMFAPVQVACVPTLYHRAIRKERMVLPPADLVIVDEAHLSIAKMTRAVLDAYPNAVKVGLTATPARGDGRGLGLVYDDLVLGPSVAELTEQGYLVPARYFAPTKPDLEGVKVQAGDYNRKQLGHRMDQPQLVGDVVSNWARIAGNRKTVVFSVNVSHSIHLRDRFREAGIAAEHLDGSTDNDERRAILNRIHTGETQVLCNCDVLTYGWDCPPISCAVLARPTKSIVRYLQMVGRVLRPHEGKSDCIVIDHSGAVDEMGFVDEPINWVLSDQDRAERAKNGKTEPPKKITCGECGTVFDPARVCPHCGEEVPHERFARAIETTDADLVELDRQKRRNNRNWTREQKADFYGQLLWYAQQHGFKQGWAAHKYREKFSVWPNAHKSQRPVEPTRETLGWVTSRNIAFNKRREKAA